MTMEPDSAQQNISDEKARENKGGLFESMDIPGLNADIGLARFDYDEESYLLLLDAFAAHAMNYVNNVKTFIEKFADCEPSQQDIAAYRIAVHSLKGSHRSIGAEEIGNMAQELELAAKQQDVAFITDHSMPFAEAAQKLISDLAAFLLTVPRKPSPEKTEMEKPDPVILAALKKAAENYDMRALRDAIEELDVYRYSSHPDLVEWLWEKADISDFESIKSLNID